MSKRLKKQLTELIKSWPGNNKYECYEVCKKLIGNAQLTGEAKAKHYNRHIAFICGRLGI